MDLYTQKLLDIKELNLSDTLEQMTVPQFEAYCEKLDIFVEMLPTKVAELKEAFSSWNDGQFVTIVKNIQSLLVDINASRLAQNGDKLIVDIDTASRPATEAYMTFFLTVVSTLSIDIQMAQSKSNITVAKPTSQTPPSQKSVLAVDDVSLMLNSIKAIVSDAGYLFYGVTSGAAALKFLTSKNPDLFILDVEMPEMNGYELAAKIRESGHTAPIIFLTGNATKEYVIKAIQAGAADFIVKPVIQDQVRDKIKQ